MIDDFARMRAVVKQPGLQHHLLRIEAYSLVRAGIVIVTPDRVGILPRKSQLKIMAWNSFVHRNRTRILGGRQPEESHLFRRRIHITHAILDEPRWSSEVIGFAERAYRAKIFWHRTKRIVLDALRNGENVMCFEKVTNGQFVRC